MSNEGAAVPGARESEQGQTRLRDIVCGVDGSYTAVEAARQAAALSTPGSRLHFVCVAWTVGEATATRVSNIGEARAEAALEQAVAIADETGISASSEIIRSLEVEQALFDEARAYDLLVIGAHGGSRAGGILLGSSATIAAHRAPLPVLTARRATNQLSQFPKKVLVASDGSPDSLAALDAAADIARRHDATILFLQVGQTAASEHLRVAQQVVRLREASGSEPVVIEERDHVAHTIVRVAERERVALVVVGSRGLSGIKALGSVSEQVAQKAPCSVLIMRPRGKRTAGDWHAALAASIVI